MGELLKSLWNTTVTLGSLSLPFTWGKFILGVFLPMAGIILAYFLVFMLLKRILKNAKAPDNTKNMIQRWVRLILRLLVVAAFMLLSAQLLGNRWSEALADIWDIINRPLFSAGNTSISIVTLLLLIPVFYVSSLAGQWIQVFLNNSVFPQMKGLDEAKKFSIANLSRYGIMGMVFFILLSIIGIDFSAIGALLAVLGIGVGFGLQDLVSNFFAGIVLIFAQQIKEKDRIVVEGLEGTVTSIRLLSTSLTTLQNENLIIPNSHITNSIIHNASYLDREVILSNPVEVHYNSNVEEVREVLLEVAARSPYLKANTESKVLVKSFNNSGIQMELRSWIRDVSDKIDAHSWCNFEIWKSFRERGIEIPYTQMDLHIKEKKEDQRFSEIHPSEDTQENQTED